MANIPLGAPVTANGPFFVFDSATGRVQQLFIGASGTARLKYYAAPGGSDSTGDGSQGNPWRTAQHLVDVSGMTIGRGVRVVGDITDLADTSASALTLPPQLSSSSEILGGTDYPHFRNESFLTLQAALATLDTLNAGTTSSAIDSVTGMYTYADSSKSWTVDVWAGKYLVGSGAGQRATICSNTATQLVTSDPIGTFTAPVKIMNCGASLAFSGFGPTVDARGARLTLNGIEVKSTSFNGLLAGSLSATCSRFNVGFVLSSGTDQVTMAPFFMACDFVGAATSHTDYNFGQYASVQRSRLLNCNPTFQLAGTLAFAQCKNTQFFNDDFPLQNVYIASSHLDGQGIAVGDGAVIQVSNLRIDNAAVANQNPNGSALYVKSGGIVRCDDHGVLAGTGNNGYGVEAVLGGRLMPKSGEAHTVTGNMGDLKVGHLPVRTWTDYMTNHPIGVQRDVFGDGSAVVLENVSVNDEVPHVTMEYTTDTRPAASTVARNVIGLNMTTNALERSNGVDHWYDLSGNQVV